LNYSLAAIDLLPQYAAKIAALRTENVLPDRLVTKKAQRISHKLPGSS
jgi:hypothetical protein